MFRSAYDLKAFYNGKAGRIVRRVLQERIREFWPDVHGFRVMGCGYATPYLRMFMEESERVFAVMPAGRAAHDWPQASADEKNLVCLAEESELPVETASVDRVLMIHHLEFSELLQTALGEIWRVLKSNGRLLVVVSNRTGFWAHADWSPFGHGTPYTAGQICHYLRDNKFIHERTEEALYMPPMKFSPILKSAGIFERMGKSYLPFGAGVHMVEASKQLYAQADRGSGSKLHVRGGRGLLVPKPVVRSFLTQAGRQDRYLS